MGSVRHERQVHVRCSRCGDVIGMYEPVVVVDDAPRETSRAAEPELHTSPGDPYHRACWEAVAAEG